MYVLGMIFCLFHLRGTDNPKRCVTFGVGLLSHEDMEYYVWLLESLSLAFKKQHVLVLSYQDATMKKAIENVFD